MDILLEQLIDLRSRHFAAIGGEVAIGFSPNRDDLFVGRGRQKRGKQLLFQHRETALQVFEAAAGLFFDLLGQIAQRVSGFQTYAWSRHAAALGQLRGFNLIGIATEKRRNSRWLESL